ncbi:unnamed protein product [Withania somnifera]
MANVAQVSTSKGRWSNLSKYASGFFFVLILLQFPLFRVPCRSVANSLITSRTVPSWDNLLNIYNLTNVKEASAVTDLQRLEVLAGSYFSVAGALIGILKPGRMSMFGTLLVVWGLIKEGILNKPTKVDPERAVYVYPTMLLALVCSFLSVKYDMKKVTRSAPARPVAKPLQSSSKAKLK